MTDPSTLFQKVFTDAVDKKYEKMLVAALIAITNHEVMDRGSRTRTRRRERGAHHAPKAGALIVGQEPVPEEPFGPLRD
jgi:hypothetical protein